MEPISFQSAARLTKGQSSLVNPGQPNIFVVPRDASPQLLQGIHDKELVHDFSDGPDGNDIITRLGHTQSSQNRRRIYAWQDPNDLHGAFISVQAAFTTGMACNIRDVIEVKDILIGQPDTVIFYSISNWGRAKRVGELFLNAVVESIGEEFSHIRHFATLSPIPKLRSWIQNTVTDKTLQLVGIESSSERFKEMVLSARSIPELKESGVYNSIISLAAFHILGGYEVADGKRMPFDKVVAGFHQGRGAVAERLCPEAYTSMKGFEQSFGIMVNYANLGNEAAAAATYKDGKPIIRPEIAAWLPPQEPACLHKSLWLTAEHN